MNAEILWKIISGAEVCMCVPHQKMCLRKSWTKMYLLISSIAPFCQWCYNASEEGQIDWLWHRGLSKDPCWEYCCISTSKVRSFRSRVKDVTVEYQNQKFHWTRHVVRFADKWTHAVVEWYSRDGKWPLGRPPWWWEYEIVKWFGSTKRRGRSRMKWKCIEVSDVENIRHPVL